MTRTDGARFADPDPDRRVERWVKVTMTGYVPVECQPGDDDDAEAQARDASNPPCEWDRESVEYEFELDQRPPRRKRPSAYAETIAKLAPCPACLLIGHHADNCPRLLASVDAAIKDAQ